MTLSPPPESQPANATGAPDFVSHEPQRSRFDLAREAMVGSQLRTNEVTEPRLVAVLRRLPREQFVPARLRESAYVDRALPLGDGRALNPALTTARLVADLDLQSGEHVLLIGAATGYAAALLAALGVRVTAVESDATLSHIAREALAVHGAAMVHWVDGPLHAPDVGDAGFDALLVDGAIERLPEAIVALLKPGARIALGWNDQGVTRLARAVRVEGAPVAPMPFAELECVALPGFAPPKGFHF